MPGSDGKKLSDMFRTKNPDDIAEGLRSVLAEQADIVDEQLQDHKNRGNDDIDPELMKNLNSVFNNGTKLHNLLRPKPGINIGIGISGGNNVSIQSGSEPRELASMVIRELEESLPPGTQITDDMVRERLEQYASQQAIEGEIVEP